MPRKKLTKSQVKKRFNAAHTTLFILMLDKMENGSASFVPMSWKKMAELTDTLDRAIKRIK